MPHRFRNNPRLEDSDDELPHAADELPEDDSGPASLGDDMGSDSQDFLDERNSDEIEAEGAAALGAEPSEALLYSRSQDQPAAPGSTGSEEPSDTASTENGSGRAEEEVPEGCLDKEGQATVLATLESITERYTWPKLYLEFLLLSAMRDPSWRRAVLCQYPREEDFVFQAAVKKVEGWLLDFRSQGTLSTWVSADPALNSAMKLPDLTQHSPTSFCDSKRVQRCAVCYRDREYGIKLFSFEGHPMRRSAYVHDRTTGIAAPRQGERATSEARMADLFGWQQFGGSAQDTGSSSDDEDCPEQDWGPREWQTALPCDRYGTRTLRRQRRHDRKAGRQDGWAFEGCMPPAIREGLVAGSGGKWQRQQQQQEEEEEEEVEEEVDDASQDGNSSSSSSSSSSGSSSDEAPLSQRPWDKSGRTPAAAAAAAGNDREHRHQTRSATRTRQHPQQAHNAKDDEPQQQAGGARGGDHRSRRRRSTRSRTRAGQSGRNASQQQHQEEDEEQEPMNSPVPAAAAAMLPPSGSRYNTRSSARKQQQAGFAARQHALSQLAAKAGRTAAKRLNFDAVRGPAAAAGGGGDGDMDVEATSSSSSDSGSDEETLAGRQRRRQNPAAAAAGIDAGTAARHRVLRHKSATGAAAAAAAGDDAAAVDAVADLVDVVDLTDTTSRRQRVGRARRVTLDEDDDEGDAAGAAMTQQPAPAPVAAASSPAPMRSPAAAAAAAGGEDDDEAAELMFTPTSASKRTRQKARILSDDEGDSADDNAGQQQQQGINHRASRASPAAAVGAASLRSPYKRLHHAEAAAAPAGDQEQEAGDGQSQLEDADMQPADEEQSDMVDLISSDSAPNPEGQQHEEGEEQEREERPFRRRGFLVGGGVCSARLRLHHLLQHWPDKATKVLLSAYGWQDGRLTEKARVERVMDRVAEDLVERAFKGIEKAIRLLNCVTGDSLRETKQGRELLELVEEAERALDVEGRTTFRH